MSQPRIEKDEDSDTDLSIDTRVSCSSEEKEEGIFKDEIRMGVHLVGTKAEKARKLHPMFVHNV